MGLEVDVPRSPVFVSGDRIRMAQVLGTLLQKNASRFTDFGCEATDGSGRPSSSP